MSKKFGLRFYHLNWKEERCLTNLIKSQVVGLGKWWLTLLGEWPPSLGAPPHCWLSSFTCWKSPAPQSSRYELGLRRITVAVIGLGIGRFLGTFSSDRNPKGMLLFICALLDSKDILCVDLWFLSFMKSEWWYQYTETLVVWNLLFSYSTEESFKFLWASNFSALWLRGCHHSPQPSEALVSSPFPLRLDISRCVVFYKRKDPLIIGPLG